MLVCRQERRGMGRTGVAVRIIEARYRDLSTVGGSLAYCSSLWPVDSVGNFVTVARPVLM